jgi:hypothetical protein
MAVAALAAAPEERRVHARVREIFAEAVELMRPFFEANEIWCGVPLGHFAQRMLRERYPALSAQEIYVFLTAARRVYAAERPMRKAPDAPMK